MNHATDERDRGPWTAQVWHSRAKGGDYVVIQSDDFHHDVALQVTGDFSDIESCHRYAEWLAGVLTSACNPSEKS